LDDVVFAPAHVQAQLLRERRIAVSELLDAHLAQIQRHNPQLNAIVTLDEERARRRAHEADVALSHGEVWGPLHGVPFTIKDGIETEGVRTTGGISELREYIPAHDAPVVARLRGAGGILLGKTNVPVASASPQTDNPIFGRTNNPWDVTRTPGGSTGGGAAALASGMSPLELGADYAGSIRLPAHFCGLYGLKPTQHRVPWAGYIPPVPGQLGALRQMACIGPLARSVEDLELTLSLIAGPDPRDWDVPPVPLSRPATRPWSGMRLAWAESLFGVPITAETRQGLTALEAELDRRGARIEQQTLAELDYPAAVQTRADLSRLETTVAAPAGSEMPEPTLREYMMVLEQRDALSAWFSQFFTERDALLCPVSPLPAFPHCLSDTPLQVDGRAIPYRRVLSFLILANLAGLPAVVLPLTRSREGLPIGVQLVGPRWSEPDLLALARRLGELLPPFQRPPGY